MDPDAHRPHRQPGRTVRRRRRATRADRHRSEARRRRTRYRWTLCRQRHRRTFPQSTDHPAVIEHRRRQRIARCAAAALSILAAANVGHAASDAAATKTRTPIKHVVIIIGENRSFDHVFGLYQPRRGETISNLLSKGILAADGTPGPDFAKAAQFKVGPQPGYYVGAAIKTAYETLPPPDLYGTPV